MMIFETIQNGKKVLMVVISLPFIPSLAKQMLWKISKHALLVEYFIFTLGVKCECYLYI